MVLAPERVLDMLRTANRPGNVPNWPAVMRQLVGPEVVVLPDLNSEEVRAEVIKGINSQIREFRRYHNNLKRVMGTI